MVVWEESASPHPILIPSEQGGIPRPQLTLSLDDNLTCEELCSIHSQLKKTTHWSRTIQFQNAAV